jgi:hypothetical protein
MTDNATYLPRPRGTSRACAAGILHPRWSERPQGAAEPCPRGVRDMIENPARHFLNRRFEDVAELGRTPESLRPQTFPERYLRPTTDHALAAASINWSDEAMASKTRNQRKRLDALRVAHSHQWEATTPRSISSVPQRRALRDGRG